jgi:quercetin dioxygenase-like cupin family protein
MRLFRVSSLTIDAIQRQIIVRLRQPSAAALFDFLSRLSSGGILTTTLKMRMASASLAALALSAVCIHNVYAQTPGLSRTIVTRADVSVPGREAVVAKVEIAPGVVVGWHTHPGDEISYIQEGETELMVAGQPNRIVKAGEGFVIPAGIVHGAKNIGSTSVKLIGIYVIEKGQPLATPAVAPAQ